VPLLVSIFNIYLPFLIADTFNSVSVVNLPVATISELKSYKIYFTSSYKPPLFDKLVEIVALPDFCSIP
jgi:hypothetical protein